jgi:hypothetical protein
LTLRGPARRLAEPESSPSSSLGSVRVGMTKGRESNLTVGGALSALGAGPLVTADKGFAEAVPGDLGRAAGAVLGVSCLASCLTGVGFVVGLWGFTVTFDVCFKPGDARAAFLATTAVLRTAAFFGIAFPGFFAALLAFFEGIWCLRLQRESARLYRRNPVCTGQRRYCFLRA